MDKFLTQYSSLVSGFHGNWKILEYGAYLRLRRFILPFLGKFGQESQNNLFKMQFDIQADSNMLNSIVTSYFLFWTENIFLGKFGPKNQICQFKMKICI